MSVTMMSTRSGRCLRNTQTSRRWSTVNDMPASRPLRRDHKLAPTDHHTRDTHNDEQHGKGLVNPLIFFVQYHDRSQGNDQYELNDLVLQVIAAKEKIFDDR